MDDAEIAIITISSIVILFILYFLLEKKGVVGFFRKKINKLKSSGKGNSSTGKVPNKPSTNTGNTSPKTGRKPRIRKSELSSGK